MTLLMVAGPMRYVEETGGPALEPGELGAACYQRGWKDAGRLYSWLTHLYHVSGGRPGLVTYALAPVENVARGSLVRSGGGLWRVESPRSGILASGTERRQVLPVFPVTVAAYVGVAQLLTPFEELQEGDLWRSRLTLGHALNEARRLYATRSLEPRTKPVTDDPDSRMLAAVNARVEVLAFLATLPRP